jgi:hypothetical protein
MSLVPEAYWLVDRGRERKELMRHRQLLTLWAALPRAPVTAHNKSLNVFTAADFPRVSTMTAAGACMFTPEN